MKGVFALLGPLAFAALACEPFATPRAVPTAIPTPIPPAAPILVPTATPTPRLSRSEAQTALTNYLFKQISDILIVEKRKEFGAAVGGVVPTADYEGEGRWVLHGQGMKRGQDGSVSWAEGRWLLQEASLTITPINSEAATLLEFLRSWQRTLPTPTPSSTPLPTPPPKLSVSEIAKQHRAAIVRIKTPTRVGSGTIITRDGHILTNWHIVKGHTSVDVIVQDTSTRTGSVVSYDAALDLAIVKVSGGPWPFLAVSSPHPSVGEEVLILGYAFDLPGESTLTRGLISAVRPGIGLTWIQTDAAINPGNSGGAALNSNGELIGVPTWRVTGGENLGFLIALFSVAEEIPRLIAGTTVASPTTTPTSTYVPSNRLFGTIRVNGASARDGTTVTAVIDGQTVGSTTSSGSTYRIDLVQPVGKSFGGNTVTFIVGGVAAAQAAIWKAGGVTELNLTIE